MANVEWASVFFNKVTSRLPDLLTEAGEGNELAALKKLTGELEADQKKLNAERAGELEAELARLKGTPASEAQQAAASAPELAMPAPAAEEAAPPRNRRNS